MTNTVTELEQRVLGGGTVKPEEFAKAIATESAADRLASLERQRIEAEELEVKRAELQATYRELADEFAALPPEQIIQDIAKQIISLMVQYRLAIRQRLSASLALHQKVSAANQLSDELGMTDRPLVADEHLIRCGDQNANVRRFYGWQSKLERVVAEGMTAATRDSKNGGADA